MHRAVQGTPRGSSAQSQGSENKEEVSRSRKAEQGLRGARGCTEAEKRGVFTEAGGSCTDAERGRICTEAEGWGFHY